MSQVCHGDSVSNTVTSSVANKFSYSQSVAVESFYEQLMHESSARKVAEHRADSLQRLLDDLRNKKVTIQSIMSARDLIVVSF